MPRLIFRWAHTHFVGFVMWRLISVSLPIVQMHLKYHNHRSQLTDRTKGMRRKISNIENIEWLLSYHPEKRGINPRPKALHRTIWLFKVFLCAVHYIIWLFNVFLYLCCIPHDSVIQGLSLCCILHDLVIQGLSLCCTPHDLVIQCLSLSFTSFKFFLCAVLYVTSFGLCIKVLSLCCTLRDIVWFMY